jgi:hypothetical protein
MSVSLSPYAGAGAQFFDNNGNPLAGGKIHTYAAGTTTPIATYTSSSGGTANANPIVLDSAGRTPAQIWLTAGSSYKFELQTSLNVTIKTDDNIFASYALATAVGVVVGAGGGSAPTNTAVGGVPGTPPTGDALSSNTTGSNNTAVGYNALTSNTDGIQNTAYGSQALDACTSGDYNTADGYDALSAVTTGNYNTGGGYRALNAVVSNDNNTAYGADALLLATGAGNTGIGRQAGNNITTGANNTLVGNGSQASSATVSNEVTIGNSSVTSLRAPGLTMTVGLKWINNGTQTVAALVAAGTAGAGARAVVTDANATTFHSIVAGGGANVVPVFSDGTNWRIG